MPAGRAGFSSSSSSSSIASSPPELDAGNLNAKYDVLIFVDGAIPGAPAAAVEVAAARRGARRRTRRGTCRDPTCPRNFASQMGTMTVDRTLPMLKQFVENGGTVIAIGGSATNLGRFLGLPMENHLVENGQPLPPTKYYVPGSVLSARVDTTNPIAAGMRADTDVFFDNSPVWKLGADAVARGVRRLAWFDSKTPLRSGWAWGQEYLDQGVAAVEATVGKGRALLFGIEILQRGQPHGTFKFLFNGIYAR